MAAFGVQAEEMFSELEYRSVAQILVILQRFSTFYYDFYKRNKIVLIILLLYFAIK